MKFSPACVSALLAPVLVTAKLSLEFDERHLAAPSCECSSGRPDIEVNGNDFRNLIKGCTSDASSCPNGNDDLNCWNTGRVTDMSSAFYQSSDFNGSVECWDTSLVTNMGDMFREQSSFDQSIAEWNTSKVTNMGAIPGGYIISATSNGIVVAAEFIIVGDFSLPNGDKQIYFPGEGVEDGQIRLCVRMALKVDYDGDSNLDYISFVDTYFDVAVDLTANTATFSNNIEYEVLDVTSVLETDVDAIITMKSYICDDKNVEVESPVFGSGEAFSICVGPADEVKDDNYSVENFMTLICKNEGETRYLVKNYERDVLTTVDSAADEDGVRAVRSVVTPGFISEDEDKFICEGEVLLSYDGKVQGRRRTITKRFHATSPSYNISNNNGNDNRRKDDSPRTLNSEESSSFEATASKNAGTKRRRLALQNTNNPEDVETLVETTATATSCKILTEETGVDTVGKQCLVFVTTITAKVSTGVNVQKAVGDIEDAISSGKFASDLETDQGIKATRCKKKVANTGGKRIRDFCPGTCKKKCKTPRGKCENLKTFRFKDKKKFTCDLFVAEKPNKRCKKKVKGTKDKVSGKFKKVKFFCPATCKKKC
ncbi:hypothetical protein FRACYDRAFT_247439 [Fragilariopsis cylindrus CCMP1102]|uniref:Uncharacterized protein n=1 Tax=Fragilariopsis cylindrus CCMP1102 TaxID=635003 RepID=A0A1E7EX08_9STRA|nr:hypothetical protein FRACYDRAFT_247439 [Fragilariopsis cylindrus CCMP1102]|eukprot:OEU10386.1 hypothetical protein FRACYDRAFT_247439 [Fragilariopsis cylindrus CCMP1102]